MTPDPTLADLRAFWESRLREAQERLSAINTVEADLRVLFGEDSPPDVRVAGQGLVELGPSESEAGRVLSRRGSAAGGRARAQTLSPERRSEIARNAARARWGKGS